MHAVIESIPDADTFSKEWNEQDDEGRLPEHDVVEMDVQMYKDLFFGPEPTKDTWYVTFIKKRRSQDNFFMCQYAVNVMRILADELQGKVRFAYINTPRNEVLKEIFDVKTLPFQILIKDGQVYEQSILQILYNNIYRFIDGEYDGGEYMYDTYPVPRVISEPELKLKYVYNWIFRQWFDVWSTDLAQLMHTKVYEEQSVFDVLDPHARAFYKAKPNFQVKCVIGVLAVALLIALCTLRCLVKCMCRCFRSEEKPKVAQAQETTKSSSTRTREKIE